MFRFAIFALAFVALGAVLAGGIEGAGLLVLAPLFIIAKVFFIMMLFGVIGGFFWRGRGRGPRGPWWDRPDNGRDAREPSKSQDEMFDEWHRHAHARDEVDRWVEPLD